MSESGDSSRPNAPEWIEKRDGRRVAFDRERIASAVARAQLAVGEDDPSFAMEIAELVEYSLGRRHAEAVHVGTTGIEEIQDLVERALIELGRASVAKAYILYRDRRARARDAAPSLSESETARGVRVVDTNGFKLWDRARVSTALVAELGLGRERADEIAQRVESRILASGLRRLTEALVRELTLAELLAAGHADAIQKHEPVSLSKREFERHLSTSVEKGERLDEGLGGSLFARWARQELLPERFLAHHRAGSLHLVGVDSLHRFQELAVPADVLLPGATGMKAPYQLLEEVARILPSVERGVVIEGAAGLFTTLSRARGAESASPLFTWLLAARSMARASGRRLDIANLGKRSPAVFCRFAEELLRLEDSEGVGEFTPRLYVGLEELEGALSHSPLISETIERLLERHLLIPTFNGDAEQVVGEVCRRRARETGAITVGAVVALDFARLARRAGPWREERLLADMSELLSDALDGLAAIAEWQRAHVSQRVAGVRVRVRYTVAPVGLAEGLALLSDGETRSDQGARLLGVCAEAVRRFGMEQGVDTCMVTGASAEAAERFASLAAQERPVDQPLLFEREEAQVAPLGSLSLGYGGALLERGPASLAELLATIRAGVLIESTGADSCVDLKYLQAFNAERRKQRHRAELGQDRPSAAPDAALPFDVESAALDTRH
jgi:hypothetical protein